MKQLRERAAEYELGSTNVYADIGLQNAAELLVKAQLVLRIATLLKKRGMTTNCAATVFGIPQPKLSKLLRGQFRSFSERRLMDCLPRGGELGRWPP